MTDRELLELAAKAAGLNYRDDLWNAGHVHTDFGWRGWNPLTDDGDALRLAVKLRLDLEWRKDGRVSVFKAAHHNEEGARLIYESSREDTEANTRRAIVRAAAEIGRSMT